MKAKTNEKNHLALLLRMSPRLKFAVIFQLYTALCIFRYIPVWLLVIRKHVNISEAFIESSKTHDLLFPRTSRCLT